MKKFLLIHWHYFLHEVIEFDNINFLTGRNASGKSTVIDALQLLLLADTSGSFFNKAANSRSARTLSGYLRGELGDDGNFGYRCLREGRFTSYICAEFYDDIKKSSFTAGCCFDHYSEHDIPKMFFTFDGKIPENEFIIDDIPLDIRGLRKYINDNYAPHRKHTTETAKDFREQFYSKLGALPAKFASLLRKTVPFNPITDISQFITEFVCEDNPISEEHVKSMQDRISSYKTLEEESVRLISKINKLKKINDSYDRYKKLTDDEKLYTYLVERAGMEFAANRCTNNKNLINKNNQVIVERENIKKEWELKRQEYDDEIVKLKIELQSDTAKQTIKRLNEEKQVIINKLNQTINKFERANNHLQKSLLDWKQKTAIKPFAESSADVIGSAVLEHFRVFIKTSERFSNEISIFAAKKSANEILELGFERLHAFSAFADNLSKIAFETESRLNDEQENIIRTVAELKKEQEILQKGIFSFPRSANDLRQIILGELQMKYGLSVRVDIFAELIEIRDERWRNAIEGYLSTQKFNIIVSPKHFNFALEVYNRIKKNKGIFGVGLVDICKMKEQNVNPQKNSLSEEIETKSSYAKIYVDYLLGRVIKCDSVSQLRNFTISITDECMLYQGYTARRLDPKAWQTPAIGQSAIKQKLEIVQKQLADYSQSVVKLAEMKSAARNASNLLKFGENDISSLLDAACEYKKIPDFQADIDALNKQLQQVDMSHSKKLQENISAQTIKRKESDDKYKKEIELIAKLNAEIRVVMSHIPQFEAIANEKQARLNREFNQEWISEVGEPKYLYEKSMKASVADIENNFKPTLATTRNKKAEQRKKLVLLRHDYIIEYKAGYDEENEDNFEYENIYLELSEVKLPEYASKIEDARSKSFEQFQEDFLSRLKFNIENVERQIKNLNDAMKVKFSEDVYRFRVIPNEKYRRFYNMITSDILTGGYNLFSSQFNESYKEEISELFSLITANNSGDNDEYERRVREYTNYRTYLDFDLEVLDAEGNTQRLSKTLTKKSGGETQTPFYLAVLASFAQIYRIGRDKSDNTIRIIIFDEAFSKMDGERIRQSIELLKKFSFQVLLSAPPDKIGDIATLVDRNLCVFREGNSAFVRYFSKEQINDKNAQ